MRSELIQTNLRCNQRCTYCTDRLATDDLRWISRAAVEARIGAAIRSGGKRIVLSGGEPTLRRDLAALVAAARRLGAERVALETNGTLVDDAGARALAAAGLDEVLVNLSAARAEVVDRITHDPGGFLATLRGIDACLDAALRVDVQAAIVRSTLDDLPALPAFLRERFGGRVHALVLRLPVSSPDPSELVGYDRAGEVVRAVEDAARRVGLVSRLAPGSGPPPCVHEDAGRVAHLYSMTPNVAPPPDHAFVEACEPCLVRDRCSGIPRVVLERDGPPRMTPPRTDRTRRRLSIISSVEEQIARELVTLNRYRDPASGDVVEAIIRVLFQCNQACGFCFVSTHLPKAADDVVEAAIREAALAGHKVTLSGGEPTLHPRIVEYVRLAKSLSSRPVLMQTNAVRLADRALAEALVEAGLDEAFVSLHGASAEVSDAVTHAPGTFAKTLRGVDHLVALGVVVQLNFVISQTNAQELPAWVALLADRWPGVYATLSFVAPSTDVVPRDRSLVPSYGEVLPLLAQAVALAESRGLPLGGFESMCGIPLCLVPRPLAAYFQLSEVAEDGGEFVKTEACKGCALESRCYGLRQGYLELHGDAELRPVLAAG
ncbi:MAG: radical SAM protein [Myxococcales bacterium]|nr:radical SAM protein [Myxococcales bacterium]